MYKLISKKLPWGALLICLGSLPAQSASLPDPTRPLGHVAAAPASERETLQLNSVLFSDQRKVAVIMVSTYKNNKP